MCKKISSTWYDFWWKLLEVDAIFAVKLAGVNLFYHPKFLGFGKVRDSVGKISNVYSFRAFLQDTAKLLNVCGDQEWIIICFECLCHKFTK